MGGLTFGIVICNDSNYSEPARAMAVQGATAIFVPTNCALPVEKADVVGDARKADIALARDNGVWVIRADVAGRAGDLVSYGSSAIVDPRRERSSPRQRNSRGWLEGTAFVWTEPGLTRSVSNRTPKQ